LEQGIEQNDIAAVAGALKAKADPTRPDAAGHNLICNALRHTPPEFDIAALLIQDGGDCARADGGQTPLMLCARSGRDDLVTQLLDKGAPVDARDRAGQTALVYAVLAQPPSTAVVRALVAHHAAARDVVPLAQQHAPALVSILQQAGTKP
jgi:ankyrin repeat protein